MSAFFLSTVVLGFLYAIWSTNAERDITLCAQNTISADFAPVLQNALFVSWEVKRDSSTPGGSPTDTALAFGSEFYSSVDRGLEFDAWFEASANGDWHWDWRRVLLDYDREQVLTFNVNADRFADDACTSSQIVPWKGLNSNGPWAWRFLELASFGAAGPIGLYHLRIPFQQNESRPIDGRNAMRWDSCLYFQPADITYRFELYYFDGGSSSGTRYSTPAMAKMFTSSKGVVSAFRYDFMNYMTQFMPDAFTFMHEIPLGYKCTDLVSRPFPQVPGTFSYRVENQIQTVQTWLAGQAYLTFEGEQYDLKNNLTIRLQSFAPNASMLELSYGSPETLTIFDFKLGVIYRINNALGTCKAEAMSADSGDSEIAHSDTNPTLIRMRSPGGFFTQGGTWIYNGRRVERGVTCNSWTRDEDVPMKLPDGSIKKVRGRWVMSTAIKAWTEALHPGIDFVPMSVVLVAKTDDLGPNFPHYTFTTSHFSYFDVSHPTLPQLDTCYAEADRRHFVVHVPQTKGTRSDLFPTIVRSRFLDKLMENTDLPLTRISTNIEMEVTDELRFAFTLFEKLGFAGPVEGLNRGPDLSDAISKLRTAISSGTFKLMLPTSSDPQTSQLFTAGSMYEIPRRTPVRVFTGFSALAMILTGCGVCVVSVVGSWLLYLFVILPRLPRNGAEREGAGGEGGSAMPAWMPSWADVRGRVSGLHLPAFLRRCGAESSTAAASAFGAGPDGGELNPIYGGAMEMKPTASAPSSGAAARPDGGELNPIYGGAMEMKPIASAPSSGAAASATGSNASEIKE